MKDLAKACHVSRGTVDRALNGRPGINEETRQLVLEKAEELGYKRHYIASSLKRGRTKTIGIIVFDLYNQFFTDLINAIENIAKDEGYSLYLTLTEKDKDMEESCVAQLLERQVDGIILASVNKESSYVSKLKSLSIPIMSIGNLISDKIPHYDVDNKIAMYDATNLIIKRAYQRIIYVSPPLSYRESSNVYAQEKRYEGFLLRIKESKDIHWQVVQTKVDDFKWEELLDKDEKTCFLCSSDIFALGIMKYFNDRHLVAGQDYGIMGFDHLDLLKYIQPKLSTVDYPTMELGATMVRRLIEEIEGRRMSKSQETFPHKIIMGDTI